MPDVHSKLEIRDSFELAHAGPHRFPFFYRSGDSKKTPVTIPFGTHIHIVGYGKEPIPAEVVAPDCYGTVAILFSTEPGNPVSIQNIGSLRFTIKKLPDTPLMGIHPIQDLFRN